MIERKFDYSNNKLEYGFTYKNSEISITLPILIEKVKENVILCDTIGIAFSKFIVASEKILNSSKTVIGLVNDKLLQDLKNKGVKNGFFRSTNSKINVAILIIDKEFYYITFDGDTWLELKDKNSHTEIFNYINHLIWTNTQTEFCQGDYKKVSESRLSVIKPIFKTSHSMISNAMIGTEDTGAVEVLISKEKVLSEKAYLVKSKIPSAYVQNGDLYVNLYDNCYYPIINYEEIIIGESFADKKYIDYVNQDIWYQNRKIKIVATDNIVKTIELPLDEIESYKPNFENDANNYKGFTINLTISYDIRPMVKTNLYSRHPNYKNNEEVVNKIEKNLKKLINFVGDNKEMLNQLESISNSIMLNDKVDKYNKFISENKFGDSTLLSKKNDFKEINYKESDIIIPSDILGELLIKDKKTYFALNDESKIEEAKDWLKENKMEAVLILG